MDWPTVLRRIDDVLGSDTGCTEKVTQIAELVQQAGSYRWVGLYLTAFASTRSEAVVRCWIRAQVWWWKPWMWKRRAGRLHRCRSPGA